MNNIDVVELVSTLAVLLFSLSVHESAHAWTANRLGDSTARHLGRISLNPLVHADIVGTIVLPVVMFVSSGFIIGWAKPVPVNTAALRNPKRDYMLVAAAGPASNLVMAAGLFLTLFLMKSSSDSMGRLVNQAIRGFGSAEGAAAILIPLVSMAYFAVWINILLAIFNMLPVSPLDGAAVLRGLLPQALTPSFDAIQRYGFIMLIALIYYNIPAYLFGPVVGAVRSVLVL